jgi:hypothetical protein
MLPFTHFNLDEFERDILLLENDSDTQNVGGGEKAVQLENHIAGKV